MEDLYPLGRTPKTFEIIISDSLRDENIINNLVKIIRVPYNEYIPKDEEEAVNFSSTLFLLKWEYCLDKNFLKNIFENKEKLKIIIRYFESIINSLKKETNKHFEEIVISALKSSIFYLSKLTPDLKTIITDEEKLKFEKQQKSDKRKSIYSPTNNERLKSLKEFCPELISKLNKSELNKDQKGQVINLITGVNITDAYKKTMTADSKELDNTIIKNDEIDFEDLKNKLNNT